MQSETRGRPRSEKAHRAILDAASGLLLERGLSAVSMDTVAHLAGVSKATIYRWWPTKEALALDALYHEWTVAAPDDPRDTGSLRGDLLALLLPWAKLVRARPYGRVIAALLAEARTDPVFDSEYQSRVVQPRRDQARVVLRRAIERGEIPAGIDADVALDLIYGPLYLRLLHGHARLTDRFVRDVVDMALSGIRSLSEQAQAAGCLVYHPRRTMQPYAEIGYCLISVSGKRDGIIVVRLAPLSAVGEIGYEQVTGGVSHILNNIGAGGQDRNRCVGNSGVNASVAVLEITSNQ